MWVRAIVILTTRALPPGTIATPEGHHPNSFEGCVNTAIADTRLDTAPSRDPTGRTRLGAACDDGGDSSDGDDSSSGGGNDDEDDSGGNDDENDSGGDGAVTYGSDGLKLGILLRDWQWAYRGE